MNLLNWQSNLKDSARLCEVAIPGAHNAGSYTLSPVARCQDGDMREQFNNGVRFFCVRLDTDKKGTIRLAHGPKLGDTLEKGLRDLRAASDAAPNEFYILDLRHYYRLKILFLEFVPKADPKAVDKLISDILEPEKYALSPDLDIKTVTMGDIRKSGKRFLLVNEFEDYDYSTNGYTLRPWTKKVHGMFPKNFVKEAPKFFDYNRSRGLYWAEMQLTANFGTEIGLMNPAKQEKLLKPLVEEYLNNVKSVPERLSKVNIIGCDFLAKDSYKCEKIIALNADKGLFN